MSQSVHKPPIPPVLALLFGILAVSAASIFIRYAQTYAPSLVIAAYRMTLASLILAPVVCLRYRAELRALGPLCLAALREQLRQGHIGRVERLPSPLREAITPGGEIPAVGDRGVRGDVALLKGGCALRKAVEMGRVYPGIAIASQVIAPEGVVHDDDDVPRVTRRSVYGSH